MGPVQEQATSLPGTTREIGRRRQYCEAQGKGRARGGPRKVTQRSFIDGGWWMVDILSLMLYIKFETNTNGLALCDCTMPIKSVYYFLMQ